MKKYYATHAGMYLMAILSCIALLSLSPSFALAQNQTYSHSQDMTQYPSIPITAQTKFTGKKPSDAYLARAQQVASFSAPINRNIFTVNFNNVVPQSEMVAIFSGIAAANGSPVAFTKFAMSSKYMGEFWIEFTDGSSSHFSMVLDKKNPHLIAGLRILAQQSGEDTIAEILDNLRALPGTTGIGIYRLEQHKGLSQPQLLAGHNTQLPLAIASSFKLYVLAALDREVALGRRQWADVVALQVNPTHREHCKIGRMARRSICTAWPVL